MPSLCAPHGLCDHNNWPLFAKIYHITKTHAEYKRSNFLFGFFVAILNCEIGSKVESIHYNSWEVH